MNNDSFLKFFSRSIESNFLEQKVALTRFQRGELVHNSDISQKTINQQIYVCEAKIDDKTSFLIEDFPFNFFLLYTIFIGDTSELVSFEIIPQYYSQKENTITQKKTKIFKKYIATKELYNKLLELDKKAQENNQTPLPININQESLKPVKPRELKYKEYQFKFKQANIIEDVKEYISHIKKLEMNKIHIIKSDKVECFVPNTSARHLKIAEKLSLPVISAIDKGFIKDSHINIFDTIMQEKIIQPFTILNEELPFDIDTKTNAKLYRDVTDSIFLKIDQRLMSEKIYSARSINFEKSEIVEEISKINHISIASERGEIPLPLFKAFRGEFVQITSEKDFLDITGVPFELNVKFLKEIYIQTLEGKQATYLSMFLKDEYKKTFENLRETEEIVFSDITDLIINLIYNKDIDVKQIIYKKAGINSEITEINNLILKIYKKLISSTAQIGGSLRVNNNQDAINLYFMKTYQEIKEISNKRFNQDSGNKNILTKLIKTLREFITIINNVEFKNDNLYFFAICTLEYLNILGIYNKEKSEELKQEFYSYFKGFKICIEKYTNHDLINQTALHIALANKLSSTNQVKILIHKNFDVTFFKGPKVFEEQEEDTFIRPNKKKLKYVFKYNNREEIFNKIKYSDIKDLEQNKVKVQLGNKEITVKDDYYSLYHQYKDYKIAFENPFFSVYLKKEEKPTKTQTKQPAEQSTKEAIEHPTNSK